MLPKFIAGYNLTTLAYGVTGSGKTYTMLGNGFEWLKTSTQSPKPTKGVAFLTLDKIFSLIAEEQRKMDQFGNIKFTSQITISYIEVYNEKVYDLLRKTDKTNLVILENHKNGSVIPGLK